MNAVQRLVASRLSERGLDMKEVSLRLGKNHAYLQQFIKRGIPAKLPEDVRQALAVELDLPEEVLRLGMPPKPRAAHSASREKVLVPKNGAGSKSGHALSGERQRRDRTELVRGVRLADLAETTMVPELDVRAAAGAGSSDPTELGNDTPVIAEWHLPVEFLKQLSPGPLPGLAFITAIGGSMDPVIPPNTRVLVNMFDRNPSPSGIFVVWDGFGLVIKNVQPIPFSEPKRVKISSENPAIDPYERVEGEAYIQGRVVGHWKMT